MARDTIRPKRHLLDSLEISVALLATATIGFFCVMFLIHGGALWRDEINSVNLVRLPHLSQIGKNLYNDSFPILWIFVLRLWLCIVTFDQSVRLFGLVCAAAVIAVLWLNAKWVSNALPLFSLALLGFNPMFVRTLELGRAYGLSIFLLLLTYGVIWKTAQSPTRRNKIVSGLMALLCAHCVYYNILFIWAILCGAAIVLVRNKTPQHLGAFAAIGVLCTLSMLVYVPTIHSQQQFNIVSLSSTTVRETLDQLPEALPIGWMEGVWIGLGCVALAIALYCRDPESSRIISDDKKNPVFFAAVVMGVSVFSYCLFLKVLNYGTRPWYYAEVMALVAVSIDAIASAIAINAFVRAGRCLVMVLIMALTFMPTLTGVKLLQTNMDIVVAKLQMQATKEDLILVNPWYIGISFQHYYHGDSQWMTIPNIKNHDFGGQQDVLAKMRQANAMDDIFGEITRTLKQGHHVWVVGGLPPLSPSDKQVPPVLPVESEKQPRLPGSKYMRVWALQCRSRMEAQGASGHTVRVWDGRAISPYEAVALEVYQINTHK